MQDFRQGLTVAENAPVSKGTDAEAPFPPLYNPVQQQQNPAASTYLRGIQRKYDAATDPAFSAHDQAQIDSNMRWDVDFLVGPEAATAMPEDRVHHGSSPVEMASDSASFSNRSFQAGVFSPIYEDQSPGSASGPDNDSSPLEPITPFGAFVDRAVADVVSYPTSFSSQYAEQCAMADYYQGKQANAEPYHPPPVFPTLAEPPKEQDPHPDTITSSPTLGYKTLSEPLAEWMATYVWKVCTTGFGLPHAFSQPSYVSSYSHLSCLTLIYICSINAPVYPTAAPSYLAPSIHSLLLATLLQPSAALLAVWYIVRLPVYFGAAPLSVELVKEKAFKSTLLADGCTGFDSDTSEGSATFRLVVLGCMLANKWLDDHTFSNKTWYIEFSFLIS